MSQVFFKVKCHIYLSFKKRILSAREIDPLTTTGTQEAEKKDVSKPVELNCTYKIH